MQKELWKLLMEQMPGVCTIVHLDLDMSRRHLNEGPSWGISSSHLPTPLLIQCWGICSDLGNGNVGEKEMSRIKTIIWVYSEKVKSVIENIIISTLSDKQWFFTLSLKKTYLFGTLSNMLNVAVVWWTCSPVVDRDKNGCKANLTLDVLILLFCYPLLCCYHVWSSK